MFLARRRPRLGRPLVLAVSIVIATTGAIKLAWLASTSQGRMVGDYISTSYVGGKAVPVVIAATSNDRVLSSSSDHAASIAPMTMR